MDDLFFILSKVLWYLADPGNVLLVLIVLSAFAVWLARRRLARLAVTLTAVYALLLAFLPAAGSFLIFLEDRFPQPAALPRNVAGVVVLGGMVDQFITDSRGQVAVGGAVERLIAFAGLAERYPEAVLVFSGGSGVLGRQELTEADAVRPLLARLGVDPARVVFEDRSRNTWENAVFSKKAAGPAAAGEGAWILVTSAIHMPRAVGCFRRAGWPSLIPYPVDYAFEKGAAAKMPLTLGAGISAAGEAVHEFLGLVFYWLTKRTDAVIPAPET